MRSERRPGPWGSEKKRVVVVVVVVVTPLLPVVAVATLLLPARRSGSAVSASIDSSYIATTAASQFTSVRFATAVPALQ
jgi:hypothetical protein